MARPRADRERNRTTRWRSFVDALQSNQNFEYLYWLQIPDGILYFFMVGMGVCFDWTMRLIGPLLLLFATGLISAVIAMYFRYLLPVTATFGSIPYCLHAGWALFLAFNVFFNYYHCAFTHPGRPQKFLPREAMSDNDSDVTENDEEEGNASSSRPLISESSAISRVNIGGGSNPASSVEAGRLAGGSGSAGGGGSAIGGSGGGGGGGVVGGVGSNRGHKPTPARAPRGSGVIRVRCGYCKRCKEPKPARAHHCHVCDQCIVNMDHHCPWMNNCVGYLNYRYFVLFLLYMFVGCAYAVLVTAPHFMAMAKTPARRPLPTPLETKTQSAVMMTFVLALSVGIAISVLLGWHLYLICTAQTTIEFYQNQTNRSRARQYGELWTNPFNVGIKGNWQQVFGQRPFLVGLLPSRRPPPPPVVEFFPLQPEDQRQRFPDEGEWTVDEPLSSEHIV